MAQQQGNTVKYGDEIRLFLRSNYLKKPKPTWLLDADQQNLNTAELPGLGWAPEEQKGGYVGICKSLVLRRCTSTFVHTVVLYSGVASVFY
jgi:hypothetical protein